MNKALFEGVPAGQESLIIGSLIFALMIFGAVYFLYLRNLFLLLKAIRIENRKVEPGSVWLLALNGLSLIAGLVPLLLEEKNVAPYASVLMIVRYLITAFVLFWSFYLVNKISASLEAEFKSRHINIEPKPTWSLGIVMCVGNVISLLGVYDYLVTISGLASLVGFIAWVFYWVKISEYRKRLKLISLREDGDSGIFG